MAGGGLYALAALAFVLVYKATRVVNIAIGEMLMIGAYLFFAFAAIVRAADLAGHPRLRCWARACWAR